MTIRSFPILCLALLGGNLQDGGVRVPEFDTEKVQASYVVSLPEAYDKAKTWPLILDFHGAIHPSKRGANLTRDRVWSKFVRKVPCIVVGLNGRTTGWNSTKGEKNDRAYALHVLGEVRKKYSVDPGRIYLAGFSSGSDYLCSGGLQLEGEFAGSLVICPGPPSVVGLRNGSLVKAKGSPFYFATGEEDYIRKDGAWQAFLALEKAGGRAMYREVPGVGHKFFDVDEYVRLFRRLDDRKDDLAAARDALKRGDYLLASTILKRLKGEEAGKLLSGIEEEGRKQTGEAERIDPNREPGRAYEAWWAVRTRFHRFPQLAGRAQEELRKLEAKIRHGDLLRARRDWFRNRNVWAFDRYLTYPQLTAHARDLQARFPDRVKLHSMGKSVEGRDLWVLEIGDRSSGDPSERPAAYVQGAIHGNEISSMMTALFFAWQMGANPARKRSIGRLLQRITLYVAPAVNPDAAHHFVTEPHSHWRPRFNYRPYDADRDGRTDEDPYEDLDGDGEIGQMYRPDRDGPYVLKDGRLVRGEGEKRYAYVGREGIDNDQDGRYSEDPPGGVNLNRNFPVGFKAGRDFEGSRGEEAASEPETRAIIDFVKAHSNIVLFVDYHNEARCLFYWRPGPDQDHYDGIVGRAEKTLGYKRAPLQHAGAGLTISWAYGELGIPAFIVELGTMEWEGETFLPARPFRHPDLGDILLGGDHKKLTKRNPPPSGIAVLAERNWAWLRGELQRMPRLEILDPIIQKSEEGYVVRGVAHNAGEFPFETGMAGKLGRREPVRIEANGAELRSNATLPDLAGDGRAPFEARLGNCGESVTLILRHPRGGIVRYPVARPRSKTRPIRKEYAVEEGFETTDVVKQVKVGNAGPTFDLKHRKAELRIGVLLGEWKDKRHAFPASAFEKAFFSRDEYDGISPTGRPAYGSVRDFYDEMSYGTLKVSGTVFDWAELPGRYGDYRDASFGSSVVSDRLMEAVLKRDGEKALDGFDGLVFIWAGNAVRRTSALWPMRITVKSRPDVIAFKMGERHLGEFAPIGVPCHELGHTFGVNDKYGLGAGKNPVGRWCLMGKGTHGAEPSVRHRPFHFCAWCKMVIGWVKPAVVDPSEPRKLALRPILHGPRECYRILLRKDGSEYLLLENRRREGFFTDLPSAGLAVFLVKKRVQLLTAHGLPPVARSSLARPEEVAWPQQGKTELVVEGVRISGIRLVDDVIYFEVARVEK